jgi:hypothetical protein
MWPNAACRLQRLCEGAPGHLRPWLNPACAQPTKKHLPFPLLLLRSREPVSMPLLPEQLLDPLLAVACMDMLTLAVTAVSATLKPCRKWPYAACRSQRVFESALSHLHPWFNPA